MTRWIWPTDWFSDCQLTDCADAACEQTVFEGMGKLELEEVLEKRELSLEIETELTEKVTEKRLFR